MDVMVEKLSDCDSQGCYKGVRILRKRGLHLSLVQWKRVSDDDESLLAADGHSDPVDDVFVWMENKEVASCCPGIKMINSNDENSGDASETTNDAGLQAEVITWTARAKQAMSTSTSTVESSHSLLANTMYILSGYAKFTYLVDTFKSSGAIDISLELLSSTKASDVVKRYAREILLTLSASDSQTNSFILSMLIKGEGKLSVDNKEVLLDMSQFMLSQLRQTSTCSTQQIQHPGGSVLCSLVKKYLKINAFEAKVEAGSLTDNATAGMYTTYLHQDKDYFYVVFDFISEFLEFHGYFSATNHCSTDTIKGRNEQSSTVASISNGILSSKPSLDHVKAMNRSDFKSDAEYAEYLKHTLKPGMKVKMARKAANDRHGLYSSSSVKEGAIGEFVEAVLVPKCRWEDQSSSLLTENSRSEKISWEQIELLPQHKKQTSIETNEPSKKKPKLPLRSSSRLIANHIMDASTVLSKAQWWEILCTFQKFCPVLMETVLSSLTKTKSLNELIRLNPSVIDAVPVIMLLKNCIQLSVWESLAIVQEVLLRNPDFFKKHLTTEITMDTATSIQLEPPYPDPFSLDDDPVADPAQAGKKSGDSKTSSALEEMQSFVKPELFHFSKFSIGKLAKKIRLLIKNNSGRCKIAVYAANCLLSVITKLKHDHDYCDCCEADLFNLVLELMSQEPRSCILQTVGIKCFYFLMGPVSDDGLSTHVSSTVMSTIISLASSSRKKSPAMKVLVNGIKCIANYYNMRLSEIQKKAVTASIGYGTMILAIILNHGDFVELSGKYKQWRVPDMVESVLHCNINFTFKKELCFFLSHCESAKDCNASNSIDWLIEMLNYFTFLNKLPSVTDINDVFGVKGVGARFGLFIGLITRYLTLLGIETTSITDEFVSLPKEALTTFVNHGGVLRLANIMTSSDNEEVKKKCVFLLGCLSTDVEVCEVLATQGGLNAVISILQSIESKQMNTKPVLDLCIRLLFNMSQSENAFALMVDCVPSLSLMLKKSQPHKLHKSAKYLKELIKKLSDHEDETEIKKLKCLRNKEILSNISIGFINIVLDDISNARRINQMPGIPFIKQIFQIDCKENIDGVQRIEASSGDSKVSNLMDGNPGTYWESSATTSSSSTDHWIKLHMVNDALVKKLSVTFSEPCILDKITIKGLNDSGNQLDIKTIPFPNYAKSGRVTILEDLSDHYSAIKIIFTSETGYRRIVLKEISCDAITRKSPFEILFTEFLIQTQFYYSIKSQQTAWAGGLSLLQVFDEVIKALHYEQKLADYLGLPHNKQTLLGKALKSSLIKKFLEIVSKNDDIIHLMERYLLSVNVSSNTINLCSTIMSFLPSSHTISHGFHLPHLNRYDIPKKMKLSSIRRICGFLREYCSDTYQDHTFFTWEKVVKLAYATFFKQTDFSCHPFIVITEMFIFNDKVKQAATELFNSDPMVSVYTRAGIYDAINNLDLTTTIKLFQCVCGSIHQLLSTKTITLSLVESTEIMTTLSELASSLLFPSIFELLYRKYLIERTLNSEKINFSLEMRVAKVFAECFPNAIPLSMVEDLTKSEIHFDAFKQSCLNSFDQELFEYQNAGHYQNSESTMDQLMVNKMMAYELVEFHVTVLSPNLWPSGLSPIPMPTLELIHPLPIFVTDYKNYFSLEGKTLTWTQYGRAQIKCSDTSILLNVSTVQMAIIMAFNDFKGKRASFNELVKRTGGISPNDISKALDALTCTTDTEPLLNLIKDENTKPPASMERQLSSTVGYYCINETLFEKLLNCGENEVSFSNTTAALDIRADDLKAIYRRRKDIIQTQIVKLMKRERQLSAHQVYASIKSICSSVFRHWFGNFDCSYYDIQREIDNLVQTGFLKRQHNNPLIIEYVVDDDQTDSEHLTCTDAPLISSFKKLNSISPIDKDNCGYIPLFQIPDAYEDLNLQSLKETIQADIITVASILNIDSDLAESLLSDCLWNVEKLLCSYFGDEEYCKKHGFNCVSLDDLSMVVTDGCCPICLNQKSTNIVSLWCGHVCCTECWYKYFQIMIKNTLQTVANCCCMYNDCFVKPTIKFVTEIVDEKPDKDLILSKFHESIFHSFIEHNHFLSFCKNPQGCDGIADCTLYSETANCEKCSWRSCISCNFIEAHDPATCEEVRQWIEAGGFHQGMNDEAKSAYLASKIAKQCPKCRMQIEKNEGCLHMICKCGHHFCWKCLKKWGENHSNYYECKEEANSTINVSHNKFMELTIMCEKIYELKVAAEDVFTKIDAVGEIAGYLPIKAFPILHFAKSMLVECYRVRFYLYIVQYFTDQDSLDGLLIFQDSLISISTALQTMFDRFISEIGDGAFKQKSSTKVDEFIFNTSKLLALVRNTLKNVSFGRKEGFRLCSHSSLPGEHSRRNTVDIERTLINNNSQRNHQRGLDNQQLELDFLRRLAMEQVAASYQYHRDYGVRMPMGDNSPVYHSDYDDDYFDDFNDDIDYFGDGYSS